ncbi:DNA-binding transcriptional repressor PuuR [Peptococcaceae bacterium CEB3]|nr:DNA-binding transcriptional repressor PuuR [Peptococcaceae bacterium CEB3]
MNNVGQRLARLREQKGLSQAALGKLVGTTNKYINDLEHGRPGGIAILAKIVAMLDVPLDEVYRKDKKGDETMEKQTLIEINGCVETDLGHDQWLDEFIDWLESRGEYFGGGTKDITDEQE